MEKTPRDSIIVRESLERIARSLDQPVSAFFEGGGSAKRETETLALVRAFDLITDREVRARCIAFISAEADGKAGD